MLDFTLYILVLAAAIAGVREIYLRLDGRHRKQAQARVSPPILEEKPYVAPPVVPLDVTLETSRPVPYRPFRYGPKYTVNMGIRALNLEQESWIEVDSDFHRFHNDKLARLDDAALEPRLCQCLPGAEDACNEVLEMLTDYLPKRYPNIYRRTTHGMAIEGCAEVDFRKGTVLANAAKLMQDDFALMMEGEDGQYYLRAGAIVLAGFWKLEDKVGMPLREIHTSGDVPHYAAKLQLSMDRYFSRLKCDKPIVRNNYFIQNDANLPWSSSIGDEFPKGARPEGGPVGWDNASSDPAIGDIYFRSERQSLRRLPRSKAILFTVRTYFHPVVELCAEPNVPGRLASAIRSWDDEVSLYKGASKYNHVLLPYLDACHRKQVEEGVTQDEEVEHKYPY